MNLKAFLLSLIAAPAALGAFGQDLQARDTITDNNIVYPSSFDTDVRKLQEHWYSRRYAAMDSIAKRKSGRAATDEVIIERLQRLPAVIDMPFNSVVKQYINMYVNKKPDLVERMLGVSLYYMPYFEAALESLQMPIELKYLPIVESALNPNAISKAGAGGLWQFMPGTAQDEGLEVNSLIDERRDPLLSSYAACSYLKKLHGIYDDWALALAAYNCGPGNVNKAIKRAGDTKDYWVIYPYLPAETRGYVPAFIAANYVMNYYYEHGISHALAKRPVATDTVHVHHRVHLQQISDVMGIPIDELRSLNPQYRQDIIPGHIRPYALILPSEQAYCYVANVDTIFNHERAKYFGPEVVEPGDGSARGGQYVEELTIVTHKVKKGETLRSIADKYGVSVQSIRTASKLKSSKVKVGAVLKVPTYTRKYTAPAAASAPDTTAAEPKQQPVAEQSKPKTPAVEKPKQQQPASKPKAGGTVTYKVKKGDTLDKIARANGVTVKALQQANNIKGSNIQAGQTLKIPARTKK